MENSLNAVQATEQTQEIPASGESKRLSEILYPQTDDQTETEAETDETTDETEVEGIPEDYNFQLPEGVTVDEAINNEFKNIARDAGIPPVTAQKLMDLEMKHLQGLDQKNIERYEKMKTDFSEQTVKKLGPEHQKELNYARNLIDQIGGLEYSKQVREFLNHDPIGQIIGNHPFFIEFLIKTGKALAGHKGTITNRPKTAAEILYPR